MECSRLARCCASFWLVTLQPSCSGQDDEAVWGLGELRRFALATEVRGSQTVKPGCDGGKMAVATPVGADRSRFAVFGQRRVEIGDGARVQRTRWQPTTLTYSVGSLGPVNVGPGASVGSIYALGAEPVVLGNNARVDGYVRATSVEAPTESLIQYGILPWAHQAGCDVFSWTVAFPGSETSGWRSIEEDNLPSNLRPGAYEALTLRSGARTRIETGSYYFKSLDVQRGSELVIDNMLGPVYVWVREAMFVEGSLADYWLISNIMFGYAGQAPARLASAFRGLLVAPRAEVTLAATALPHSGAFFAQSVVVEAGAVIEHRPFVADPKLVADLPCAGCASAAREATLECCSQSQDSTLRVQSEHAECLTACQRDIGSLPACEGRCAVFGASAQAYPRDAARACVEKAAETYAKCQLSRGFRPNTCAELGFPPPGTLVCEPSN